MNSLLQISHCSLQNNQKRQTYKSKPTVLYPRFSYQPNILVINTRHKMCNKHTESLSSRPPLMTSLPLRETTVTFILKIKERDPVHQKKKKKANPVNLKGFCSGFRQNKKLRTEAPYETWYSDLSVKQNIEMAV